MQKRFWICKIQIRVFCPIDYSDFTLTGSRVVGLKRLAKDHERRKAARSNNNGRKASKALDDVNLAEEAGRERKRSNQRKASRNESKRKFSKKGSSTKKVGIVLNS